MCPYLETIVYKVSFHPPKIVHDFPKATVCNLHHIMFTYMTNFIFYY